MALPLLLIPEAGESNLPKTIAIGKQSPAEKRYGRRHLSRCHPYGVELRKREVSMQEVILKEPQQQDDIVTDQAEMVPIWQADYADHRKQAIPVKAST